MFVNSEVLHALRGLRALRQVVGNDVVDGARRMLWAKIRSDHSLDPGLKYKVVTDDTPNAGQIRVSV